MLFAIALAGGMLFPWAASRLGAILGLRSVFALIAAAFLSIATLTRVAKHVDEK